MSPSHHFKAKADRELVLRAILHAVEASRLRLAVAGQMHPEAEQWRAASRYHSGQSASLLGAMYRKHLARGGDA